MELRYKDTGREVVAGDVGKFGNTDEVYEVIYFREPSSPNSSGKVTVRMPDPSPEGPTDTYEQEYYVSVIGAEWVEREDR